MVRDRNREDLGMMDRSGGARERVSIGRTRFSWMSRPLRLTALVLAIAAGLSWAGLPGPSSSRGVVVSGHTRLVEAVAFSPDGRTLASCGFDGRVRLWDMGRREGGRPAPLEVLDHPSVVYAMAFSADGRWLATAADRCLTIWSRGPSYRLEVERPGETYHGLAFSPDGRTLALGAEDGTIRLWEVPTGRERSVLRGHAGTVRALAYSADGKRLVSGGQEGRLMAWDAGSGAELRALRDASGSPIRALAFSPDGRTLGLAEPGEEGSDVLLFDPEAGTVKARLLGHPWGINALAFSPDGRTVATAGLDRSIKVWDLAAGQERMSIRGECWLKSLAYSPDGRWLAYAGGDEQVRLVEMEEPHAPQAIASGAIAADRRTAS